MATSKKDRRGPHEPPTSCFVSWCAACGELMFAGKTREGVLAMTACHCPGSSGAREPRALKARIVA